MAESKQIMALEKNGRYGGDFYQSGCNLWRNYVTLRRNIKQLVYTTQVNSAFRAR